MIYSLYNPQTDIFQYLCETFTIFRDDEYDFIPHQSFVNVGQDLINEKIE